MKRSVRGIAFVAAVLAHVALIAVLVRSARPRVTEEPEAARMTLVFLEAGAREGERSNAPPEAAPPTPRLETPEVTVELPQLDASSAITLPREVPAEKGASSPSVDWQQETRTAAARMAESLDAERRRNGAPANDPRFRRPTPRPEFGWDRSKTHRIESLPQGGTVIHLNDRCAIVLSGLLLPVCKIGSIPARGDLFEHMGDAHDSEE